MRDMYEASAKEEVAESSTIDGDNVAALFESSGIILADGFKRQIDEVAAFHAAIISNRRSFLTTEMHQLSRRTEDRNRRLDVLSSERHALNETLSSGGALDEMLGLQAVLSDAEVRLATIDEQIAQARGFVSKRAELKLMKEQQKSVADEILSQSRGKLDGIADRFSSEIGRASCRERVF